MRAALETLLQDLSVQLQTLGVTAVVGKEIDLDVTNPEMLKHAQLPFYDSQNADGFNKLSASDQSLVSNKMVDANKHEFSKNVGIALWNAAVRALYIHDNPISAGMDKSNNDYVDSQYVYIDNERVTKPSADGSNKVGRLVSPTKTPTIVDIQTLNFAKSYLKSITALIDAPNAFQELDTNLGRTGKFALKTATGMTFEKLTTVLIQKAEATREELVSRIAEFEARMRFNAQTSEEQALDYSNTQKYVEASTNPAKNIFEEQARNFQIRSDIKGANNNIGENFPEITYAQKIKTVKRQIEDLEACLQSFPTDESLATTIEELKQQRNSLSKSPRFRLQEKYLVRVAENNEPGLTCTVGTAITRVDKQIDQEIGHYINNLELFKSETKFEPDRITALKANLVSLIPVLEELDRLDGAVSKATQLLQTSENPLDISTASKEELQAHQKLLSRKMAELEDALHSMATKQFENASDQHHFEAGKKSLGLTAITEKLQAQRHQIQIKQQEIASNIRRIELENAQGNIAGLVDLKQRADAMAGIHSKTLRDTQNELLRLRSYARIAQEFIDIIEKRFANDIAKTEALIENKSRFIAKNEIRMGDTVISSPQNLEVAKSKLERAKDSLNATGIPISDEQFDELKYLMNWDESLASEWSHVKNNSTVSWLSRGLTRATSSIMLTDSPEASLTKAIDERTKEIDLTIARKHSLEKSEGHLEQLRATTRKESAPYFYQKRDAESQILDATTKLEMTQREIDVQKEILSLANQGFEQSLGELVNKLNESTLNKDSLEKVKHEFSQLVKTVGTVFDIKRMQPYRDFKRIYPEKEAALTKQELMKQKVRPVFPPVSARNRSMTEESVYVSEPQLSLYDKYFHTDDKNPQSEGLATKYIAHRAASYATFDKLDYVFTQGLKFFSCGGSKAKTDQEARIDYLGKIANALGKKNEASTKEAYDLIEEVLNDPKRFPARATVGSAEYKHSMRALLTSMKNDLVKQIPALANNEASLSAHL